MTDYDELLQVTRTYIVQDFDQGGYVWIECGDVTLEICRGPKRGVMVRVFDGSGLPEPDVLEEIDRAELAVPTD